MAVPRRGAAGGSGISVAKVNGVGVSRLGTPAVISITTMEVISVTEPSGIRGGSGQRDPTMVSGSVRGSIIKRSVTISSLVIFAQPPRGVAITPVRGVRILIGLNGGRRGTPLRRQVSPRAARSYGGG